jgi:uncharacterized protein DUF5062
MWRGARAATERCGTLRSPPALEQARVRQKAPFRLKEIQAVSMGRQRRAMVAALALFLWYSIGDGHMKKLKNETELFKAALLAGVQYAQGRKAVEFEATDSASDKALYVYRLLVHDKVISPMPEDQVGEKTIRRRLATWYAHQLPEGHPLLK